MALFVVVLVHISSMFPQTAQKIFVGWLFWVYFIAQKFVSLKCISAVECIYIFLKYIDPLAYDADKMPASAIRGTLTMNDKVVDVLDRCNHLTVPRLPLDYF